MATCAGQWVICLAIRDKANVRWRGLHRFPRLWRQPEGALAQGTPVRGRYRRAGNSKVARTLLRGIRVDSKQDLKERIEAYLEHLNAEPTIHRWSYKMDA